MSRALVSPVRSGRSKPCPPSLLALGGGLVFLLLAASSMAGAATVAERREREPGLTAGTAAPILESLRDGGYIIYLRHAATAPYIDGNAPEDLARCETQRNLSAKGKADSAQIGRAIKALAIPIGKVAASPYCRTKDTALLAFGRFDEDRDLGFVVGANASETRRLAQALRQRLGTPPEPGTNNVIVSHSANLLEAAGIFAKPEGAAYIFRPLENGRFEAVARLLPEDWESAEKHKAAVQAGAKGSPSR